MRVRALDDWKDVLSRISERGGKKKPPTLFISAKSEYLVYGLRWQYNRGMGEQPVLYCEIVEDFGNLIAAPLEVFEVIDGTIPNLWRLEQHPDGAFLWPDLFFQEYFFDDFSDGVPDCVKEFRTLQERMAEAGSQGVSNQE